MVLDSVGWRAATAALLMLATTLAGCASPPPPPAEPQAQPHEQAGLVSTSDAIASGNQSSEGSEFAKSLDEKFHTHNYWGTALEKTLMDADVQSADMVPIASDPLGPLSLFRFGLNNGFTPFDLPDGSIVPPESTHVSVDVKWASSTTITGLQLAWRNASAEGLNFADSDFPDGGGVVDIPTWLENNDQPHTTVSKWRFFLVPSQSTLPFGPSLFNGTAHVIVKAYRNDTLYIAPPHPDFWHDNDTMLLMNMTGHLKGNRLVFPVFTGFVTNEDDSGFAFLQLPNGTIVPPHTGLLTVTINYTNAAVLPNPFTVKPELLYSPASTRGILAPDGEQVGTGSVTYTINVDARMVDSPYANESTWFFLVDVDSDAPTDSGPFIGDVGFFDGDIGLTIVAEREKL